MRQTLILGVVFVFITTASSALAADARIYYSSSSSTGAGYTSTYKNYLDQAGYSTSRYNNLTSYDVRRYIGGKEVFHIWQHAAAGRQQCRASSYYLTADGTDTTYYKALDNKYSSLPDLRLFYFEGCRTSHYSGTYGDLDNFAYYSLGVDCTLAYSDAITYNQCNYFAQQVYYHTCLQSTSISNGVLAARADMLSLYGQHYGTDSIVRRGDRWLI